MNKQCQLCDVESSKLTGLEKAYFTGRYPEGKKKYTEEEATNIGKTAMGIFDKAIDELNIPENELKKELGTLDDVESVEDMSTWIRVMGKNS